MNVTDLLDQYLQTLFVQLDYFINATHTAVLQSLSHLDCDITVFSPLQWTLLKVLLLLLIGTSGLIWYSWLSFGDVITEKFVRPSTLKEIEELKLSVAKLKLPKEHSPRI